MRSRISVGAKLDLDIRPITEHQKRSCETGFVVESKLRLPLLPLLEVPFCFCVTRPNPVSQCFLLPLTRAGDHDLEHNNPPTDWLPASYIEQTLGKDGKEASESSSLCSSVSC
jgi:hypothetical protein